MGGGPPEPPRPGIGVDLRNLVILLMLVAVIIGVFRQCHSKGTEDKTELAPQESTRSAPQERSRSTPQQQPLSRETQQSKRGASCLTATQRMDKNGVLPRDYSINCPYWQWWTHKPTPPRTAAQPSPDSPHSPAQSPPDPPRTQILPESDPPRAPGPQETDPPRMHMFPDPETTRRERDALRYRRERDWCCCPF